MTFDPPGRASHEASIVHPYTYYALKGHIRVLVPRGPFRLAVSLKASLVSRHALQGFLYKEAEQTKAAFDEAYAWLKALDGHYATQIDVEGGALNSPVLTCEVTEVIRDRGVLKFMLRIIGVDEEFEPWLEELARQQGGQGISSSSPLPISP